MSVGKFVARASIRNDLGLSYDQYFLRDVGDGHFVWYHPLQYSGGPVVGALSESEAWSAIENWANNSGLKVERS
jgi:hypothetical protein